MKSSREISRIIQEDQQLYDSDGNMRSYYQDIADFCLPRKAWINSIRIMGERLKDNFLYDIRAIRCLKEATCGFHANLTNPSSRWFKEEFVDDRDMQMGSTQKLLDQRDDIIFDVLNGSNFDNGILENYIDQLAFGTAHLMTQEDEVDQVRFNEVAIEKYTFSEDSRGRVNRVYITVQYTAIQCVERWGNKCPKEVTDAEKDKPFTKFDILFYIGPRDRRDPYKIDRLSKPWESCWIMKKPEVLLEESGFEEFPSAVGRFWKDSNGDPRGFSPAMDALASIKLLNAEKRTFIRSSMKKSDPAWMSPYRGFLNAPNFNPSAGNYYDAKHFKPDAFRFIAPEGDSGLNMEAMNLELTEIERAFYCDVFRAISNVTQDKKKRSIPEVQRVVAEGMSMLGPIIGKIINETLNPTLERTANILERRKIIPPIPKDLLQRGRRITYLSPLARAQKQSKMMGIASWMQAIGEMAQFNQAVLDPVDFDRVSKVIADIQGVDASFYIPDEKVAQIRKQRAQMQAAQQKAALAEQAASGAEKGANAQKRIKEAQTVAQ